MSMETVCSTTSTLDTLSFTPSLAFASVHIQTSAGSAAGQAKVDNFRVLSLPLHEIFEDGFESGNTSSWSAVCPASCGQ